MTAILIPHKIFATLALIAGLLITSVLLSACNGLDQQEAQQVNEALSDSLTSTNETWNLDLKIIEEGLKKVRLQGNYAASYNTDKLSETRIQGPVLIHVFDSTNTIKTWVDSDSAIYRAEDSEFEFFGNVRVRTRDERRLESEYLRWDQAENNISTPEFVIITTPQDSIAGTGFTGASDLSTYTIRDISGQGTFD